MLTLPLPTKPIAYPVYIWDDFDVDTTYGDVYRLNKNQKIEATVVDAPVVQVVPKPTAIVPKSTVVDRSAQYNQETNKNLDTLFKKEMQK